MSGNICPGRTKSLDSDFESSNTCKVCQRSFADIPVEIFSLASVLPFLGVLANPEKIWEQQITQEIISPVFNIRSADELLLPVTILFGLAAVIAASLRLLNIWLNGKLAAAIGSDIAYEAYRRTLYQEYSVHVSRNSSSVISALNIQVNILVGVLNAILLMISSGIILIALLHNKINFGFPLIYEILLIPKSFEFLFNKVRPAKKAAEDGSPFTFMFKGLR